MRHVVRPGDCVASLAATHGTSVDAIWNAPENRGLREQRSSPYMLCAGDVIELPEPPQGGGHVDAGGSHRFRGTPPSITLELLLVAEAWSDDTVQGRVAQDEGGKHIEGPPVSEAPRPEPLVNAPYRLTVGGRIIEGRTDGAGKLSESIDARATVAVLEIEPETSRARSVEIHLGYLDPPDEPSGLRQRLSNLGYVASGDDLSLAVEAFQKAHGLEMTGILDDATKRRIVDESEG